jgi:hypothetical protein
LRRQRTRTSPTGTHLEELEAQGRDRVLDGVDDALSTDDIEPAARTEDTRLPS